MHFVPTAASRPAATVAPTSWAGRRGAGTASTLPAARAASGTSPPKTLDLAHDEQNEGTQDRGHVDKQQCKPAADR